MIHLELIEKVTQCNSLADLQKLCAVIASQYGFDYYALVNRNFSSLAKPRDIILSNYPEDWQGDYLEKKYELVDPVIFTSLARPTPVIWQDAYNKHPEHMHIFDGRRDAGVHHGISASISMPGMITMFSFAAPRISKVDLNHGAIVANAYIGYLHERLLYLCFRDSAHSPSLTQRQIEIVLWLAEGKDISSIASIMKCSERTVSAHIQTIKEQTNSLNITHAVAKTLMNIHEFNRIVRITVQ